MPLDEMFGLSLVSSGTVTVAGISSNYSNFQTVLDIQGVSGFLVFVPDTSGTKDFPDMNGAIPFYGTISETGVASTENKWLLPLVSSKRYTFRQKCNSRSLQGNLSYYSTTFTYAIYSFGGGIS